MLKASYYLNLDIFFFLFLLQFDEEECLCKAPLPECWVVRKLLYDVVCAAFSNHYVSLVNQMSSLLPMMSGFWCLYNAKRS